MYFRILVQRAFFCLIFVIIPCVAQAQRNLKFAGLAPPAFLPQFPTGAQKVGLVRLHLPKGHAVASFDSTVVVKPETLPPMPEGEMYFPFGGSGSPPAHLAGSVFEFQLLTGGSRGATSTSIELVVGAF